MSTAHLLFFFFLMCFQVPFGKLAFMPGKLVHTNQLLVLLGDNWFVERSAKQAEDIAQRRIQGIKENCDTFCLK